MKCNSKKPENLLIRIQALCIDQSTRLIKYGLPIGIVCFSSYSTFILFLIIYFMYIDLLIGLGFSLSD